MTEPTINQYLLSICLFIIDEMNELYRHKTKEELKVIANSKYNEMDIIVKIGYFFKQAAHYTIGDGNKKGYKINHDLYVAAKDFEIEVKYLKNWNCGSGSKSSSKSWAEYQKDYDWLIEEIANGHKHKRAFIIGWFNCVDYISQYVQLGASAGNKPLINPERVEYFPFLRKLKSPTYTCDLLYNYDKSYQELSLNLIGKFDVNCNCLFLGNENDKFHFAVYY